MYPNLIEDLTDGTVDHDYDLQAIEGRTSIRSDVSATFDEPAVLKIAHNESGKGENLYRNSTVRIDRTVTDTDGNQNVISFYVVGRIPLKTATAAQCAEVLSQLTDFFATADYATRFINGEI